MHLTLGYNGRCCQGPRRLIIQSTLFARFQLWIILAKTIGDGVVHLSESSHTMPKTIHWYKILTLSLDSAEDTANCKGCFASKDGAAAVTWPSPLLGVDSNPTCSYLTSSGYFWQCKQRSWSFWWGVESDYRCTTLCWHWIRTLLWTQQQQQPRMYCPTAKVVFCCIEATNWWQDRHHQPAVWRPLQGTLLCVRALWIFLTAQSEELMIWWVESEEY